MDEDGSQSKAVARALHRFGIKVCPPSTCDSCILKCVIYKICSIQHSFLMAVDEDEILFDATWRTPLIQPILLLLMFICVEADCLRSRKLRIWVNLITETLPNGWGLPSLECIRAANKT
jgi:hypothetical protein